jgi:hypothetical protein
VEIRELNLPIHYVYQIEQVLSILIIELLKLSFMFFEDGKKAWSYSGPPQSVRSSLTIFAGSLQLNRTYQFAVYMEHVQNNSIHATGYVVVQVQEARRQMIAIG